MEIEILVLIILLVCSAFFSGTEIALFSLSRLKVKSLLRSNLKGIKSVDRLKKNPQRLLITILIGNNLVNIASSAIATSLMMKIFDSYAVGIATGVMTIIILIFGEITPKSLATKHNKGWSIIAAKPLIALQYLLFPVVIIFEKLTKILIKDKEKPIITEDDIKSFVSIGQEIGQIEDDERRMIHRIFKFNDMRAKDIMIPRKKIVYVKDTSKIKDIIPLFNKKGNTRLIVCRNNLDIILGSVHLIDVNKINPEELVIKIMRPVVFVPESIKIDNLLKFLQRKKKNLAIVIDNQGKNAGLVTTKDIVEEIVGELIEETEKIEPLIEMISHDSYRVQGKADVDEINNRCGIKLPERDEPYEISKYIKEELGRMPKENEVIKLPQCEIKIEKMDGNNIEKIIIKVK